MPSALLYFSILLGVVTAIVNIIFALGVRRDAQRLQMDFGRGTWLVGGAVWTLATLLGGVFVAAIYWLIHYSALGPRPPAPGQAPRPQPRPGTNTLNIT